jgi:hypothetical protein
LTVQPLYDIYSVHDSSDIITEMKVGADNIPIIFPVIDGIRAFLSPFIFRDSSSASANTSFGAL